MIEVAFRSRNRSRRVWVARFDMGSDYENALAALTAAFKHNAEIISAVPAKDGK